MSSNIIERFRIARKLAENIGGSLTESGAPRGEVRRYHLKVINVVDKETSRLSEIEKILNTLNAEAK